MGLGAVAAGEKGAGPRRVAYFDVAKALAMVAVIAGHTALRFLPSTTASATVALAFSFHMPLFFMVSGYFLRPGRQGALARDARSLLVPYAAAALAVVAGMCATNLVLRDLGPTFELCLTWLGAAVFAQGDMTANPLWPQAARIGAIWFLWALFWARLEVRLVERLPRPARWPVVLAGFVAAMLSTRVVFLPLSFQPGICAALFVYTGRWLGEEGRLDALLSRRLLWVPFALVWGWAFLRFSGFGMAICGYGVTALEVVRNVAGGLAGSVCVLWACRWLEGRLGETGLWSRVARLGRLTLLVLCVHLFEDNVLRWGPIVEGWRAAAPWAGSWLVLLAVRVVADFAVAALIERALAAAGPWARGLWPRFVAEGEGDAPCDSAPAPRDLPGRIGGVLYAIGLTVVALFAGILAVFALGSTSYLHELRYELFDLVSVLDGGSAFLAAALVACVVLLACCLMLARCLRHWDERVALVVAVAVTSALGLWWVFAQGAQTSGFPDAQHLIDYATAAAGGDWSSFTDTGAADLASMPDNAYRYFVLYPFQSGVFYLFLLVAKLFPTAPVTAILVLNVIANEVSLVCLYLTGRHLLRGAGARAVLLALLVCCLPMWLSAALPYGNSAGLALGCVFLLLQAHALALPRERRAARLGWVAASLVPLAGVMVAKSTFVLLGIAAVIAWVVKGLRTRQVLLPAASVAVLIAANVAGGLPARALEAHTGLSFGEGMPKTSWIVMGLNESDITGMPGWWDLEPWEIMLQAEGDMELQSREASARIVERVGELAANPAEAVEFFSGKLASEWCDPTFESLFYAGLNVRADGTVFDPYVALGVEFPAEVALVPLDGYQSLVYLGALLGFVRLLRRGDATGVGALLAAVFLAGFGCYLLWEAKSVYTLPFFFLLLPVAAYGVDGLASAVARCARRRPAPRHAARG